jgi:thioredoxin-like negative regulator of GroEL
MDGQSIRFDVQVLDGINDNALWVQSSAGGKEALAEMRRGAGESITSAVTADLAKTISRVRSNPATESSFDPGAFDNYVRRQHGVSHRGPGMLESGIASLEKALEIAPGNLTLLRKLAVARYQHLNARPSVSPAESLAAIELAERMEAVASNNMEASLLRGLLASRQGDLEGWARHLWSAHRCNLHDPDTLHFLATGLVLAGQGEAARVLVDRLAAAHPASPGAKWLGALLARFEGRFTDAVTSLRALSIETPGSSTIRLALAHTLAADQRRDEALATVETIRGDATSADVRMATVLRFALLGEHNVALHMANADVDKPLPNCAQSTLLIADSLASVGATTAALDWLGRAIRAGIIHYRFLDVTDPMLRALRTESAFHELVDDARVRWNAFDQCIQGLGVHLTLLQKTP